MLAYARARVIITDAHNAQVFGCVFRQAVYTDAFRNIVAINNLILHGEVFLDEFVHARLNLLLFLACRFMVENEAYLAFLAFDVSIARAFASEHSNHCLVEQVFCRVSWRKLLFVVCIEYLFCIHTQFRFKYYTFICIYIHVY